MVFLLYREEGRNGAGERKSGIIIAQHTIPYLCDDMKIGGDKGRNKE